MLDKERRKKAKEERNQEKNKNGDRQERDKADDVEEKPPKSDNIQTEIRTDDFVLVVKKSEPDIILNGRAALCAGREIIPLEEKRPDPKLDKKKGSRLVREEDAGDDEVSDDERVDMNAITGSKERDERRNQFYAMENDCMCLLLLSFGKATILLCL
uniref:Uncharacterized protein n=1 Tax=Megaselia scalaris TaxID=36166 RepID=T1H2Z7_MEGSC